MTMTSPLRGPKSPEGGGFAAAHFPARRACYGAAPPAPRVLRIALRATALRAALGPGDHCGPWARKSGQARPAPALARGAQIPAVAGAPGLPDARERGELAFDSHKERENYKPREASRIKRG
jgi:hypothetical protein